MSGLDESSDVPVDGDESLATQVLGLLGPRHEVFAAATVTSDQARWCSHGASLGADFEIGSISKGVTGLLYADAVDRGEVSGETKLSELLPLSDSPVGDVTLAALATHRSGLPSVPRSTAPLRRTVELWSKGRNPYRESVSDLMRLARDVPVGKPRPRYSNLGFQLLGQAVAAAAETTYPDLVEARVAKPLGLDVFYIPTSAGELRPEALVGTSRRGREREAWVSEALAPAGGIRATIESMARLTTALLDGTAPGLAALDPVAKFSGVTRIGAAWITLPHKGRDVTWHNGGTGGFRTWLGIDRAARTGAVILSATSSSVDRHGFQLLSTLR